MAAQGRVRGSLMRIPKRLLTEGHCIKGKRYSNCQILLMINPLIPPPPLSATEIQEQALRIISETAERIARELVPGIAEKIIREEIEKLKKEEGRD